MSYTSGEAADQVVKIVLDGTDILVRATGDGARDFIRMLLSELRKPQKTKVSKKLYVYRMFSYLES